MDNVKTAKPETRFEVTPLGEVIDLMPKETDREQVLIPPFPRPVIKTKALANASAAGFMPGFDDEETAPWERGEKESAQKVVDKWNDAPTSTISEPIPVNALWRIKVQMADGLEAQEWFLEGTYQQVAGWVRNHMDSYQYDPRSVSVTQVEVIVLG